ncbi:MAG TPA: hypothetical protein VGG46_00245 [Terriglobales bacterium]|jgi:hypothetical protein
MDSHGTLVSTKIGWVLSLIGFLLLLALGNLGLMAILVPTAALLAVGVMMLPSHKDGQLTHGLK